MSKSVWFPLAVSGFACMVFCQEELNDASTLLRESILATAESQRTMGAWTMREAVHQYNLNRRGLRKLGFSESNDVWVVGGKHYFQRVMINGRPLPPRSNDSTQSAGLRKRKQAPESRVGFQISMEALSHSLQKTGTAVAQGRQCWVVSGTLVPESVPKDGLSSSDFKMWIDQATRLPLREEYVTRKSWSTFPAGSTATIDFTIADGVRMIQRIVMRGVPDEKGNWGETIQDYSSFKRFQVDSTILFEPPEK